MPHQNLSVRQVRDPRFFAFLVTIIIFSSCQKNIHAPTQAPDAGRPAATGTVMTPEGPMPASQVHRIEPGYHLAFQNGHVMKVHTATGKSVEDFGEFRRANAAGSGVTSGGGNAAGNAGQGGAGDGRFERGMPAQQGNAPQVAGWITYTEWLNTSGQTLNYFSTNTIVPTAPTENDGQLVYIFEGLQDAFNGSDIMQPVLQWGSNGQFGGNYWCIANWYVWLNGAAYSGPENNIASGTALQGVITYTGNQGDGSFNYTSSFAGHPNSAMNLIEGNVYNSFGGGTVALPGIPQQFAAFETLEAYKSSGGTPEVLYSEDYPPDPYVSMSNIQLQTGNAAAALNWTALTTSYATFKEFAAVISNNSAGAGDVNLFFRYYAPKINGSTLAVNLYTAVPSASGTITAYPGQSVTVQVNAFDKDPMATSTIHWTCNTSGVTWTSGSGSLTTTCVHGSGTSASATFIMPASGSINWSATYTQSGGSTLPYDGASVQVY